MNLREFTQPEAGCPPADEPKATALVRIDPTGPAQPGAIRVLLRISRRVRRMHGFLRWQTFRALDASNSLLVLIDWSSADALKAASADEHVRRLSARAPEQGFTIARREVLTPAFDRRLVRQDGVATLLRVGRARTRRRSSAARDSRLALQSLAAPGSTRLHGSVTACGTVRACRIDFDTEDGLWHFLESQVCRNWSAAARRDEETETWALNLPRLDYRRDASGRPSPPPSAGTHQGLNVQVTRSEDGRSAQVRFQGAADAEGAAWYAKVCEVLLGEGCDRLEVDVSGLAQISVETLEVLAQAARRLKQRGGQFVLIDNEARVRRVTRSKHLDASVR